MRVALLALLLVGCPPTLSRPRSAAHEDHLARGEREMRHGRFDAAAEAFGDAAEQAQRRVDLDEALYRRSRALRRADRFADAVVVLDEIARRRPPSRRTARAVFDAARIRDQHLSQTALALQGYERIVRHHSDEGPAARALSLWLRHLQEESVEAALECVTLLSADLGGTDLADDLLMAEHRLRSELEDREGARRALERLVREHPYPQGHRWDDAILRLADMDLEDGRPAEAVARLERMLERAESTTIVGSYTLPAFPEAQIRIARIQRDRMGDVDAARRAFRAVVDDFPDSRLRDDAMVELGEMLLEAGNDDGCRVLREALDEFEVGSARRRASRRVDSDCPPD